MNSNEQVLTAEICGLVIVTTLLCGVLHFFLENKEYSLEQFLWNSMTSIFFITTINLKRSGSRIIQISFWFMVMVISSTYIAKMTNILTIEQPLYQIKDPYKLNGRRVITYSIYNYQLIQYGAIPLTSDFGSNGEYDDITADTILKNLSREDDYKVDAYVVDDVQAQLVESGNCDLFLVARMFIQFNYGVGYYINQDISLISKINKEIQKIVINQSSEKLSSEYIDKNYDKCTKSSLNETITFDQVGGVFVIQGIAICVSILLFLITKVPIYQRLRRKLIKNNILSEIRGEVQKDQGDELVLKNIKQVTREQIMQFEQIIEDRLDQMDENIIKFYEILLNEEQLKKLKIITDDKQKKELQFNSLQTSKINEEVGGSVNIFSSKKIDKIDKSNFFNDMQIKQISSEKYDKTDSKNIENNNNNNNLNIIGEVEMAEFDNSHNEDQE